MVNEDWEERMKRATVKMIDAGFWKKLYGEKSRPGREVPREKKVEIIPKKQEGVGELALS